MAVAHVIGAGSDAGSFWLQVPLALTMAAVLTMLGHRLVGGRAAARPPALLGAPDRAAGRLSVGGRFLAASARPVELVASGTLVALPIASIRTIVAPAG